MFKVDHKDTRMTSMIAFSCPKGEHLTDLAQCFSVLIVDFQLLNAGWDNVAGITRLLFNKNAKQTNHHFIIFTCQHIIISFYSQF